MKVQDMAQNLYSDTRGQSERPVTFTEAVIDGLAAGGGLYVPERIPELSLDEIGALAELPYAQRAARIYRAFDVDLPAETVEALMAQAYGDNFDDERITHRRFRPGTRAGYGTAPRARSRTWRCSACRVSSPQAPPSCASRASSTTTSSSW